MVHTGQRSVRAERQKVYTYGGRTRPRVSHGHLDLQSKKPNGTCKSQLTRDIGPCIHILQLNIEGISRDKCEHLSRIARDNNIDIISLQETHLANDTQLQVRAKVPGYKVVANINSDIHGSIMYLRQDIDKYKIITSTQQNNNTEIITVEFSGMTISAVYKPPNIRWPDPPLPTLKHPGVYLGDFNCHHVSWGYSTNDENGESLSNWMDELDLHLVYDAKDLKTFHSARWRSDTNPDLCFVTTDSSQVPLPHTRKVLRSFPRSQHRPVIINIGIQVPLIKSTPKPRWNFRKADWTSYSKEVDSHLRWIPPKSENYGRFAGVLIGSAKRNIPRGYRKEYIPCWNKNTETLYREYEKTGNPDLGSQILHSLHDERRERWESTTENMDFTASSRRGWSLLRRLGAATPILTKEPKVTPSQVALHIKQRSENVPIQKEFEETIKEELKITDSHLEDNPLFSSSFTNDELNKAIRTLKLRKAAGLDGIFPEFIKHLGHPAREWLRNCLTDILNTGQIPEQFRIAQTLAIQKPGKPSDDPASYRPIALLSVCYKLLERLIYNRIYQTIDDIIPPDQAGFRSNRSCCEQVLALTSYIESGYQRGLKTSVAFVDLTAAYDTVWLDGLMLKLKKTIPCSKLTKLMGNMLRNRYFKVTLGHSTSKSYTIRNGLPQGSVLAPILFNLYTSDMPATNSRKFCYADDTAIATQSRLLEDGEETLTADLENLGRYYKQWRLCPNPSKTEVCAFHLNNHLANKDLNVTFCGKRVKHNSHPKYLGVTLDRTLTYKRHLEITGQKLKTRNNIIRKLAGTTWGAKAETLRTAAESLVFSTAEYCAPVWYKSSHTNKVDVHLNDTMRIISGTLKSTPVPWLHALTNLAPPDLRRQQAAVREWAKLHDPKHPRTLPIHMILDNAPGRRLKSRNPIWQDKVLTHHEPFHIRGAWKTRWTSNHDFNHNDHEDPTVPLPGMQMPRKAWCTLNRIRTGHARCRSMLYKWGLSDTQVCDCGAPEQTVAHIAHECPIRRFEGEWNEILRATPAAVNWLTSLDIDL